MKFQVGDLIGMRSSGINGGSDEFRGVVTHIKKTPNDFLEPESRLLISVRWANSRMDDRIWRYYENNLRLIARA